MNRFLYILCLLFVCNVGNSQTLNDIGKIVIGVKVLPTENKETLNSKVYLQNRLIKLSSEYGFTSYGLNTFYLTPSITINDIKLEEGGMQNIYVVEGEVYLTIQDETGGNIFANTSFPFRGIGNSKERAITDGLQKISFGQLRPFFDNARLRILELYSSMQDKIFAQADMLVKNKEFDAAIACLMTVPEELHDLYKKTYSKACEIYQAREKYIAARAARKRQDANNSILVKAQGQLSAHNPTEALKTLWEYSISNTSQDGEYRNMQLKAEAMISSAEQTILEKEKQEYEDRKAKEEREYQDKRQEYNDNMRLKNRQIDITEKEIDNRRANQNDITNAVKSIALAYIDKSKRI